MDREDKKRRILEIRRRLLTTGGEEDAVLLSELDALVVHPEPTSIIFNMEAYSEDAFFAALLDYQPIVLPNEQIAEQ